MSMRVLSSFDGVSGINSSLDAVRGKPPGSAVPPPENSHGDNNISSVVQKAKKAASSLFCILHAQTCTNNIKCDKVRGCIETKKILLHMKQCSVGPNFPCSTPGCNQVRKLMSHYRRCRDLRLRATPNKPHHCLVCSLLAREVKTFQEQMEARGLLSRRGGSGVTMCIPVKEGRKVASNSPLTIPGSKTDDMRMMPPPPPRSIVQLKAQKFDNPASYGSPPHIPEHMKMNINSISNIVSVNNEMKPFFNTTDALSKSVDSVGLSASPKRNSRTPPSSPASSTSSSPMGTPERRKKRERSASAGNALDSPARNHRKPDVEDENSVYLENCRRAATSDNPSNLDMSEITMATIGNSKFVVRPQLARRRSSSCGVIASLRNGGFSTIPEEEEFEVGDSDDGSSRRGESFDHFGIEPFNMEDGDQR